MVNDFKIYTKFNCPYYHLNCIPLVVSDKPNLLILHKDMSQTPQVTPQVTPQDTPQVAELLRGYKNCGVVTHKEKNDGTFLCKIRVEIKDES